MTVTSSQFQIRLAEARDAKAIVEIYNEAVRTTTATFDTQPQSVEQRLEWLACRSKRHPVWVAEVEGNVVGWAALNEWSSRPAYRDTGETSFYVATGHQGQGIGRALKATTINEARRLGYHVLLARVAEGSEASLHLNESFGFERIGIMKEVGFKFGRRLDVVLLQLLLNGRALQCNADQTGKQKEGHTMRTKVSTGTPWEEAVGYCGAVRVGDHIFVSGTTASDENGNCVHVGDAYRQTTYILSKIKGALAELGAELADVTRTRMFVTDIERWEEIGRAHGESFGGIQPATAAHWNQGNIYGPQGFDLRLAWNSM